MSVLKLLRPSSEAEKTTRTTLDVMEVTPNDVKSWKLPTFQRELKVNAKLLAIAAEIRENDGVIPGVLTLGMLGGERYLIDGQHRRHAFLLSECPFGYVDVRVAHYKSMAEMSEEFQKLNGRISIMKPDDFLRAAESTLPELHRLIKRCPFIGYDSIRRGPKSPLLSASFTVRAWWGSGKDSPVNGGITGLAAAEALTAEEAAGLGDFLEVARTAWGTDPEYHRLWGGLNITLCMWLYRRTVVAQYSARTTRPTKAQFQKCLVALSADEGYLEWLRNRQITEKTRSPAYSRIKAIFVKRLEEELGARPVFPAPEWMSQ